MTSPMQHLKRWPAALRRLHSSWSEAGPGLVYVLVVPEEVGRAEGQSVAARLPGPSATPLDCS